MALELKPIRVNVIRPGIVDTPLLERMAGEHRDAMIEGMAKRIPVGRVATTDEVAAVITFLCSDDASYLTGTTIDINGGSHIH